MEGVRLMGWWGTLLGTEKAIERVGDVADSGMELLDNAFYTDQERAVHAAKLFSGWLRMQEVVATQSSPTALSRRYIAWSVVGLVWIAAVLCFTLVLIGNGHEAKVDEIVEVVKSLQFGWGFVAVIVFYFGTHVISKIK